MKKIIAISLLIGLTGCDSNPVMDLVTSVTEHEMNEAADVYRNVPETQYISDEKRQFIIDKVDEISKDYENYYSDRCVEDGGSEEDCTIDLSDIEVYFNLVSDEYYAQAVTFGLGYIKIIQFEPNDVNELDDRAIEVLVIHEIGHIYMNTVEAVSAGLGGTHGYRWQQLVCENGGKPWGHSEKRYFDNNCRPS